MIPRRKKEVRGFKMGKRGGAATQVASGICKGQFEQQPGQEQLLRAACCYLEREGSREYYSATKEGGMVRGRNTMMSSLGNFRREELAAKLIREGSIFWARERRHP